MYGLRVSHHELDSHGFASVCSDRAEDRAEAALAEVVLNRVPADHVNHGHTRD